MHNNMTILFLMTRVNDGKCITAVRGSLVYKSPIIWIRSCFLNQLYSKTGVKRSLKNR